MLTTRPFKGNPKRLENIIKKTEETLWNVIEQVKIPLIETFDHWLKNHALLDPQMWADQRTNERDETYNFSDPYEIGQAFDNMLFEYKRYKHPNFDYRDNQSLGYNNIFFEFLRDVMSNINNLPVFKSLGIRYLEGYKEMLIDDLSSEGFKSFGERMGQNFNSPEEAQNYINNLDIDNIDIYDYIYDADIFKNSLANSGVDPFALISELNQHIIFPLWYDYWKQQGIDETRENIENIFNRLNGNTDLKNTIANINLALNASHQNGSMLDYLEEKSQSGDLKGLLDSLTEGKNVKKWNKQLREIGVKI
jgi:hypothetical protein